LSGLVELVQPAQLCLNDYKYMAERISTLTNILSNALDTQRVGVNILVWRVPGLGKSQLARLIAQSAGRDLVQIT
jgi:MoxR-like ATPase